VKSPLARAANAGELAVDSRFLSRVVVVAAVVAVVGLAGCGRKGALEAPPGAAIAPATTSTDGTTKNDGIAKPDKKFVLDPLMK
jgi:predicted small lipoprotein YifL